MLSTNVVPANPARPNGPGSAGVHPARRPPVGSVVGAGATSASRAPGIRLASICSASLLVGRTGRSVTARPGRGQWRIAERRWCAPERSPGADERQPVGGLPGAGRCPADPDVPYLRRLRLRLGVALLGPLAVAVPAA